jgi:predicted butyrate kinase (DUF1464 family)
MYTEIDDGDIVGNVFHLCSHVSKNNISVSGRLTNVLQFGQIQLKRSLLMNPGFVQKLRWSRQTREAKGDGDSWL